MVPPPPSSTSSDSNKKGQQRPQNLNLSDEGSPSAGVLQSPKDSFNSSLRNSFKRVGSMGKGSKKKPTAPQGPSLATEARSLVRPCNCGKDGVFHKKDGHSHDHHHKGALKYYNY